MEPRTGEDLGCFHLSKGRAQNLETPYEIGDEVREPVHRFGQADQGIRAFLLETPHPGSYGKRAQLEDAGGLSERPATGGTKFENRQPRGRRIMRPSVGLDMFHPGVLDADLLAQEQDLLPQPVLFSLLSKLRAHALRSPAMGQRQGGPSEGDDLDDGRADPPGPASGERKGCRQGNWGHGAVSRKCARLKRWETAYPYNSVSVPGGSSTL